jgi:hypothetical protein
MSTFSLQNFLKLIYTSDILSVGHNFGLGLEGCSLVPNLYFGQALDYCGTAYQSQQNSCNFIAFGHLTKY